MAAPRRDPNSLRMRLFKRLANAIIPGEIRRETRKIIFQRAALARDGILHRRPSREGGSQYTLKQGSDVLSQVGRFSRNDVAIRKEGNRILWRRRIRPAILTGIYDTVSWIHGGIDEIERWVNAEGWDIIPDPRNPNGDPKDRDFLLDFFSTPNTDGDYLEDLIGDMVVDSYVQGDHFTNIARVEGSNEIGGLFTMDAESTLIETDLEGNITAFVMMNPRTLKETARIDPTNVIQFRRNARGRTLFGASVLKPLFLAVESDLNSQIWNRDNFKNNNAARNAWIFPQDTSDESMDLNETVITGARGPGGTHQDIVLRAAGGEITIKSLNRTPSDMEFEKGRKMSRGEFLAVIGTPPMLLGIVEAGSIGGGTGLDQIRIFLRGVVKPNQRRPSRLITDRVIRQEFGISGWMLSLRTDDLVDDKSRAERAKILADSAIFTIDEIREELGKGPMEEVSEAETERAQKMLEKKFKRTPTTKALTGATGETEIVPIPLAPLVTPSVMKLKAGILRVLRGWRARVRIRINETLAKQDFGPDDFDQDIQDRSMELVLLAGIGTAARAGLRHGRSIGGDPTDVSLVGIQAIAELRSQELAAEIAGDIRIRISTVVIEGIETGAGAREIADDVLKVFDNPKIVQVAASVDPVSGQITRQAHERIISAESYAETLARTEASKAANEASLLSLENAGVSKVIWQTARFRVDRKICLGLDGKVFDLQAAKAARLIPAHPNCRCTFRPAKDDAEITGTVAQVRALQRKHQIEVPGIISKEEEANGSD